MTDTADEYKGCRRAFWYELYSTQAVTGVGDPIGDEAKRLGLGQWRSPEEAYIQRHGYANYREATKFKRPWVSGQRPWQYKDSPKYRGKTYDVLICDDITDILSLDYAEIEKRQLAYYTDKLGLTNAIENGLKKVESKTRWLNTLRQVP
jgi:hypothetical protein